MTRQVLGMHPSFLASAVLTGAVLFAGPTMAITVVSNAQVQYSFPRERLEPGRYSVGIRAVGYELQGTPSVEVTAAAALDLNLVRTRNLAAQLSNGEWLQSFTGTEARKEGL